MVSSLHSSAKTFADKATKQPKRILEDILRFPNQTITINNYPSNTHSFRDYLVFGAAGTVPYSGSRFWQVWKYTVKEGL